MFKVFFFAVVCFMVADARRLNKFFWDDDSIAQHFNNDINQRDLMTIPLCLPKIPKKTYQTVLVPKGEPMIRLKENAHEYQECESKIPKNMENYITCKKIEAVSQHDDKILIGCEARGILV